MGSSKRLRIFGGPNGSGKSTFIKDFPVSDNLKLGVYINADDIEKALKENFSLNISELQIAFSTEDIQQYFKESDFAPTKLNDNKLWRNFTVSGDFLHVDKTLKINSYIAADLAEFFRQSLMKAGISFSFETVMSDHKKIEALMKAKEYGYRIYLYYFSTEDPAINISRVDVRVAQDGHPVAHDTITKRYYKSLENLREAIKVSNRAYIFDNSGVTKLFAEITEGTEVEIIDSDFIPTWFITNVIEK